MLIAAASHSHWYTSGTFYAAAGVAVVLIGAITFWVMLFASSTKRRLTYSLADDPPLLARTTALAQGDLEVLYQGQRVGAPRVVSVRLESRGRRDIGSDDFDERPPPRHGSGSAGREFRKLWIAATVSGLCWRCSARI